jgi:hypothetical protein
LTSDVEVIRIHLETEIAAPIERVFDLARDIDLHERSMAQTDEQAVGGRTTGRIGPGQTVTFRARHLGRWWRRVDSWTSTWPVRSPDSDTSTVSRPSRAARE